MAITNQGNNSTHQPLEERKQNTLIQWLHNVLARQLPIMYIMASVKQSFVLTEQNLQQKTSHQL